LEVLMKGNVAVTSLMLTILAFAVCAAGQAPSPVQPPASTAPPPPPDMVCFGYGPNWSVQFVNGEARYIGINEPDQDFLGNFHWVPNQKTWVWQRQDDQSPPKGSFGLSAQIRKAACHDSVRKQTYPYSAQVNLPEGDSVNGCCRKLRPDEAPVGAHGLTPVPNSQNSQPQQ
jgi:uncharacterized membrane protein